MHNTPRRARGLTAFFSSLVLSLLLAACGGGGGGPDVTTPPTPNPAQNLTVSGKIVAPDGVTPISNALVYIENSSAPTAAAASGEKAAALACGAPPNTAWAATCTGSDGSFSLAANAPADAKLVAIKGVFRVEQALGAASGGAVNAGSVALVATGATSQMAVVTGTYDSIEDVLAKLGFGELENGKLKLGTEKFTLYDGGSGGSTVLPTTYPGAVKLFEDADGNGKADIFNYAIVFWNCEPNESIPLTATNQAIMRAYVEAGGRIYASDLAYDIVEQTFPEFVDFLGSDATAATAPEAVGEAEQGTPDITVNATVDPALAAWLQTVTCAGGPCVQTDGTVKIDGFLGGWGVINGPHSPSASVRTWASGPVSYGATINEVKPLTVSFGVGAGRVTYTSYHNEAAIGAELFPQQRILQYLVFEL